MAFVRKDLAIDGVDDDLGTGAGANASANCDQANHGLLPVSGEKGDDTRPDYGGEVRGECLPSASDCDPNTCVVYPDSDPNYHEGCRYATEFRLSGVNDTVHPDRHPFDEPLQLYACSPLEPMPCDPPDMCACHTPLESWEKTTPSFLALAMFLLHNSLFIIAYCGSLRKALTFSL